MRFKTLVVTVFILAVMFIVPTTRGWLETLGDCIHDAFAPSEEVVVNPEGDVEVDNDVEIEEEVIEEEITEGGV